MSFAFSWKKTFDRVCNVFFPMVMATEVGKQENARNENRSLSIPDKINAKCVGNSFAQLPAERNGVSSRPKLPSWPTSLATDKYEDQSSSTLDIVTRSGEPCSVFEPKSSLIGNNDGSNNKSDVSQSHLRQLLLLHLDLIQQQQQQIQEKDKEIVQLKNDKEQLESRIHRMERRMAVKRQSGDFEDEALLPGESKAKRLIPKKLKYGYLFTKMEDLNTLSSSISRKPSITELMRRKSIPAAAPVLMSSKIESNVNIETCLRTERLYLDNVLGNTKCETRDEHNEKPTTNDVPTPKFRIIEQFTVPIKTSGTTTRSSVGPTITVDNAENLDDETFFKRHQRFETDEKKRKRWDIQRYRALKQREELQEKYKQREEARLKGRKCPEQEEKQQVDDSFVPECSQLHTVEMSDTVPVAAFGAPVQSFKSREFDLPWFSLDKRELQEREKLRSRGRARRKSGRKHC